MVRRGLTLDGGIATNGETSHDAPWREWLAGYFPHVARFAPSPFHTAFWDWIDTLQPDASADSFVGCVFRGGGKSTTFELGAVRVGTRLTRRFALVVCETQDQADERVQAIRTHFETIGIGAAVTKQGHSKGWRRDQLRTANGFNVAGIGLDTATRGVKLDEYRPDWIHVDDIDNREDTEAGVNKKERTLTQSIFKAGARHVVISFCQNLIHADSIMARVLGSSKNKADYLISAKKVGPIPAAEGLKIDTTTTEEGTFRYRVTEGTPTWEGYGVPDIEHELNQQGGLRAFLRECQHKVDEGEGGGLWDGTPIRYMGEKGNGFPAGVAINEKTGLPDFYAVAVAIDPSGSKRGDEVGIVAAGAFHIPGKTEPGVIVLDDVSDHLSPNQWATESVALHRQWDGTVLAAESNFGGEMVEAVIKQVPGAPRVTLVHASRGKLIRAEPVHQIYEQGRAWHRRRFVSMESELNSWHPSSGDPSPGRLDAMVWAVIAATKPRGDWDVY